MMRWEEMHEGADLPALEKPPVDRVQLVKYAGASGDFNRMHYDDGFAREGGYPGVFAHGMLIMGFLGQLASDLAGGPGGVVKLGSRFRAITWPGDVVTCRARVVRKDAAARTVDLQMQAVKPDGTVVVEGTATIRVA